MATKSQKQSTIANRHTARELAQAAALNELKSQAAIKREKTNKLRKLRLEKQNADSLSRDE